MAAGMYESEEERGACDIILIKRPGKGRKGTDEASKYAEEVRAYFTIAGNNDCLKTDIADKAT